MSYELTPVQSECPICKSTNSELLHTITSDYAAQYYALKELEPERNAKMKAEIERLWEGNECRILRCRECGFCYADPFVPGDSPFYSLFYDAPSFPKWKWEYEETFRFLQEKYGKGAGHKPTVLEIGAGTGMFVKKVSQELTDPSDIVALEYSDAGKKAIEQLGIRCYQDSLLTIGSEFSEYFDVICMYQVLEHMNDLDDVFAKLYEVAAAGAHLFIAVPNSNMLTFYEEQNAWLDNAPVHTGRWNRENFEMIGSRHGWELEYHSPEPDPLLRRFTQFALYKYVHHTKRSGSLYNWAESRRNRILRYVFQLPLIALMALRSLPAILTLMKPELGSSQLVRFVKRG